MDVISELMVPGKFYTPRQIRELLLEREELGRRRRIPSTREIGQALLRDPKINSKRIYLNSHNESGLRRIYYRGDG